MSSEREILSSKVNNYDPHGFYYNAFGDEATRIWYYTPFKNEVENIAYHKALSCWLRDTEVGEYWRRILLYYYLKPYFRSENAQNSLNRLMPVLNSDNSYLKRALKNICILYDSPPEREILKGGESIKEAEEEIISDIWEAVNYNNYMDAIYQSLKLTNEITANFIITPQGYKWRYYYMDKVRVRYDKFDAPQEIWINYAQLDEKERRIKDKFWVWTKDKLVLKDSAGENIEFEYNGKRQKEVPNVFGRLPHEILKLDNIMDDTQEVIGGGLWELARAQLECNKLDRSSDEIVMLQGFRILGLINMGLKDTEALEIGPGSILRYDVDGTQENPQAPYPLTIEGDSGYLDIEDYKKGKIRQALKNMGLPTTILDENPNVPESGIAMKEMRKELIEMRQKDVSKMQAVETKLLKLMLCVLNNYPASEYEGKFPDWQKYRVSVNYGEMDTSIPFDEKKMIYDELLSNDYIDMLEHYKRLTDDNTVKTTDDLKDKINKNKKIKEELTDGQEGARSGIESEIDDGNAQENAEGFGIPEDLE